MRPTNVPSFHDGWLTGMKVAQGGASLFLKRSDGKDYELSLHGVFALHAEDFREGNIVSALDFISGAEAGDLDKDDRIDRLFPGPHPLAAKEFHEKHRAFRAQRIDEIKSGKATLVIVEPSYGADVVAVCAGYALREAAAHNA